MIYYSITTFDTLSRLYWWYFCTLKALLPIYLIYSMVICVGTNWWHTPQHLKPKLICNARPLNFPKTQNSEKSIMKAQWNEVTDHSSLHGRVPMQKSSSSTMELNLNETKNTSTDKKVNVNHMPFDKLLTRNVLTSYNPNQTWLSKHLSLSLSLRLSQS